MLQRGDARLMLSGHEHNFQHNRVDGIDYIIGGAAGKVREERPDRFDDAGPLSWAAEGHFLIVDVEWEARDDPPRDRRRGDGTFAYLQPRTPAGDRATMLIVIER